MQGLGALARAAQGRGRGVHPPYRRADLAGHALSK